MWPTEAPVKESLLTLGIPVVGNVARITAVISRGKLYDRKQIEELLESGKRLAGQN